MTRRLMFAAGVAIAVFAPAALAAASEDAPAAPFEVRADLVAGDPVTGRLLTVDEDVVRMMTGEGERVIPLATVRQLTRTGAAPAAASVRLTTTDGGTVAGTDFVQDGGRGLVRHAGGTIDVPIDRVRRVAWLAADETEPGWLAERPERPATDLLVVRREDGQEFVECAVAGVSAEHVTVVVDGETIPVKRTKVVGIEWLRADAEAGGTIVRLEGGRLPARAVRWSPEAFSVDEIRLPPAALVAIDFAAGRTTFLASLPLETVAVEPFFAALGAEKDLAAFFAPRTVVADDDGGPAALVVRPRTVATWRVPAGSRRFRGTLGRSVPEEAAAAVEVAVAVDGREAWRRRLGGGVNDDRKPVDLDLDVADGRRLTLTVDFVPGDPGCGVRLVGGAFEK